MCLQTSTNTHDSSDTKCIQQISIWLTIYLQVGEYDASLRNQSWLSFQIIYAAGKNFLETEICIRWGCFFLHISVKWNPTSIAQEHKWQQCSINSKKEMLRKKKKQQLLLKLQKKIPHSMMPIAFSDNRLPLYCVQRIAAILLRCKSKFIMITFTCRIHLEKLESTSLSERSAPLQFEKRMLYRPSPLTHWS